MKYFRNKLLLLSFTLLFSSGLFAQEGTSFKLVYEADANGKVLNGSLEELNDYVSKGHTVRVGWAMGSIFHWADAMFLTQYEGHVFAQIHSIFMQLPSPTDSKGDAEIKMTNKDPNGWTAILGTTGGMAMKWNGLNLKWDKEKHKTEEEFQDFMRKVENSRTHTKWVVVL